MRARARIVRLSALGVLMACPAAQASATRPPPKEAADSRPCTGPIEQGLLAALRVLDGEGRKLALDEQIRTLDRAVEPGIRAGCTTPTFLRARLRLGQLLLHAFAGDKAARHFAAVGATAEQQDLRGAALYGKGLCLELARDLEGAKATYSALQKEQAGTRYGGWAEAGLARLARAGRGALAGQTAARFGPRLDLDGQSRELRKLERRPALLVFWSPDSQASIDRLLAYRAVWVGTEPREQMLAFAATGDREQIDRVLRREDLRVPILTCDREFLDEVLLDYAVTGVPDALLLGPDGTIVARDPSPSLLVELLAELRSR